MQRVVGGSLAVLCVAIALWFSLVRPEASSPAPPNNGGGGIIESGPAEPTAPATAAQRADIQAQAQAQAQESGGVGADPTTLLVTGAHEGARLAESGGAIDDLPGAISFRDEVFGIATPATPVAEGMGWIADPSRTFRVVVDDGYEIADHAGEPWVGSEGRLPSASAAEPCVVSAELSGPSVIRIRKLLLGQLRLDLTGLRFDRSSITLRVRSKDAEKGSNIWHAVKGGSLDDVVWVSPSIPDGEYTLTAVLHEQRESDSGMTVRFFRVNLRPGEVLTLTESEGVCGDAWLQIDTTDTQGEGVLFAAIAANLSRPRLSAVIDNLPVRLGGTIRIGPFARLFGMMWLEDAEGRTIAAENGAFSAAQIKARVR